MAWTYGPIAICFLYRFLFFSIFGRKLAKKMFEDKTAVIRSRGIGNVNDGKIQDYSLISFDIINKDDDALGNII